MKYGIVSDIHGNYEALKSVINDMAQKKVDKIISLGDVVGYGPQPHECIKVLRERKAISVLGNHDAGVIGKTDLSLWRVEALVTWADARKNLPNEDIQWLSQRPYYYYASDFLCVHGSPTDPIYEYIYDEHGAKNNSTAVDARICFSGHTHLPTLLESNNMSYVWRFTKPIIALNSGKKYFINPGSVGQPRDHDSRAAYLIYDDKVQIIRFERVKYNIARTQQLIHMKKYPKMLANRLSSGY
jgi:putative phosphoesterase